MDGFLLLIVLNIDDICENGEQLAQELRIGIDSCAMDGWAVVITLILFDDVILFQLIQDCKIPCQQTVVLLWKVQSVVVGVK